MGRLRYFYEATFFIILLALAGCSDDVEQRETTTEVPVELNAENRFLSAPFLQMPARDSVKVVWFTSFEGRDHTLHYADENTASAETLKMSRMMEDAQSNQLGREYEQPTRRDVFRHEATARNLTPARVDYYVTSVDANGHTHKSETFTLAPAPLTDQPLKILLTSDLQLKKNAPANYQKVVETVGVPDAVFFAGDLVNVPDRASEWFDNASENAPSFFPSLQGRYQQYRPGFAYNGGEILQHAPLFATIGNHEVMGRFTFDEAADDTDYSLGGAFNAPQPEWYARVAYEQVKDRVNPTGDAAIKAHWIADQSHNQQSYRELFTFPDDSPGGEDFYAIAFGDVFLISMNVSRIWRGWNVGDDQSGKFKEAVSNLDKPDAWGFGEFLFERFDKESEQYAWLEGVLESDAFKQARYKVVMAHQGVFGLGDNTLPVLAQPLMQLVETINGTESITELTFPLSDAQWTNQVQPLLASDTLTEIRYQYPLEQDIWRRDIEPLLVENGVDLVHIGHSHLWNRAQVGGMHYLETSNVGNSYGAYYEDPNGVYTNDVRASYANFWDDVNGPNPRWRIEDYPPSGDPQGREMITPNIASPMSRVNENYGPLPFVASNELSVFSILDTGTGTVKSYVFDPSNLDGEVELFDEFSLAN
ncbi:metallophosphoesterase [Salinisphaera sp.]|uniref:metallophosphoesterase n=1 Tax=Salinisphaera sp. TaxID=1914330 RepID=UPI000C4C79EF|nr:metallophosphoesterase [Salinisphaera sp.]MBS61527.1 metallophosphoesterase [Salinisphaera sp.]